MKPIPKILSLLLGLLVLGISVPFLLYLGLFILLFFDPIVLRGMIPLLAAFLVFLLSLLFKGAAHKKVAKFAGILTLVGLVTTLGSFGYTKYMDSIRVVDNTSIDTEKYLAFHEDSELVRLDHEASLKFTILDDLPVVDGAAALFPMYSSFVNAVYPPNIGELNRTDISPYRYSNTIGAYDSLMYKECDVIFAAGPGEFEKSFFGKMDVEMEMTPIGREGFVFFVNEKNPVKSLTQQQLRDIYSGKITNWKEVGGEDCEIIAYQRNRGSGSQTGLLKFMGDTPVMDAPSETIVDAMSGIIDRVADYHNFKGAIGFSYHFYATQLRANKNLRMLAVDGIEPSNETIGAGEYPITDDFYAITRKGDMSENTRKLIDWILSEEGQYIVKESGYAPVKQ